MQLPDHVGTGHFVLDIETTAMSEDAAIVSIGIVQIQKILPPENQDIPEGEARFCIDRSTAGSLYSILNVNEQLSINHEITEDTKLFWKTVGGVAAADYESSLTIDTPVKHTLTKTFDWLNAHTSPGMLPTFWCHRPHVIYNLIKRLCREYDHSIFPIVKHRLRDIDTVKDLFYSRVGGHFNPNPHCAISDATTAAEDLIKIDQLMPHTTMRLFY